ncbi:MAG: ABC transporter permease, partial [Flammeovirgaceae bacterium]
MAIALLIHFEFSYDNYHNESERIYRVASSWPNQDFKIYATPIPLAEEIRQRVTGVEKVAIGLPQFSSTVWISPEKIFKQSKMIIADKGFIDIFKFESVAGDLHTAIIKPYTALLSQSTATKFFGEENPIGKSFKLRNKFDITVGGVYKDLPANSNLPATIILSYVENEEYLNNGDTWYFGRIPWTKLQAVTYITLEKSQSVEGLQLQLDRLAEKNINKFPENDKDVRGQLILQQLSSVHLQPEYRGSGWVSAIAPSWLWFFGSIGAIVLALACINFLNLTTAQAVTRAREVGVRKMVGAGRFELINQFLCETMLIVGLAWLVSVPLVLFSLPAINALLGKNISIDGIPSLQFLVMAVGFVVVISFLAGIYPAWFIARFKAADSLKGSSGYSSSSWLRRSLVVTQMSVSVILLVVVIAVFNQVRYVKNINLGVIRKNVLSIEIPDKQKGLALAEELRNLNSVNAVSLARTQAVSDDHWWNGISANKDENQTASVCAIHADANYY